MKRNIQLASVAILASLVCMGATCRQNSSRDNLLAVHSTAREAFVMMDSYIAPQYEEAGDKCIEKIVAMNLSDLESRMTEWRACMDNWNKILDALQYSHEIFVEMELVYNSISEGRDQYDRWQFWARSLLIHARNIINSLEVLEIKIPEYYQVAVETVCEMVGCDEGQDG